ncbi:hypothetical protein AO825_08195 [Pectobacterium brasiliense]|uniref:ClpX C4-type zinc finger protein n=1 Tax=Pectobacterium brasiliense TaxID=180957 RepID=UPI0001A4273E|nr:hypothetical protein KS44_06165 [Pectobacterium brasiliense]KRF62830.1 hypothetical protein AO825_08195 [Pectobacterium brasiliense]MBN3186039.1 hypothetical protein [Pectobacterium brasiliense]QHG26871.1 hypothetical protein GT391_01735 [Pectobacterium brasiliense]
MIKDGVRHCSFCGKSQNESAMLVVGKERDASICNLCIGLCVQEMGNKLHELNSTIDITPKE